MFNISGQNISIRDWSTSDLNAYREWNKGDHKWKTLNAPYFKPKTIEDINEEVSVLKKNGNPFDKKRLVIADNNTDQLIGTVGWYWQSQETLWMSIGIAIYDEKYWGKGIGYQALGIWIDQLFKTYPEIVRLDLRTWSGNEGMVKLSHKLGFKLEARFRKARMVNGVYYDSLAFGILREEWDKMYPNNFTN